MMNIHPVGTVSFYVYITTDVVLLSFRFIIKLGAILERSPEKNNPTIVKEFRKYFYFDRVCSFYLSDLNAFAKLMRSATILNRTHNILK